MKRRSARQSARAGLVLLLLSAGFVSLISWPAPALTPEEMLADPVLEDRARALSKQLRCLVCQNQSIDESDADLAQDLRREVRALLQTGASDVDILQMIQNSYGDYVLLNPPISRQTWLLWLAPVLILLGGGAVLALALRPSRPGQTTDDNATHTDSTNRTDISPADRLPLRYIAGVALVLIATAGLLYGLYGRPDLPDQPLAERAAERAQRQAETQAETAALRAGLDRARQAAADQPDSIEAWLQLALAAARARPRTEHSAEEIDALQTALQLSDGAPEIKAMIAEALSRAADGQVTVPARRLIDEILQDDPNEPRALFLWGLAAYQDETYQLALDRWMYLYRLSAGDAPWRARLEDSIRQAAQEGGLPLPDFTEVAAQNATGQKEMINQMVAGLEARLNDNSDDRDGWLRLARSYEVLGRTEAQINALFRAADLAPSDEAVLIHLAEVILQSGGSELYAVRMGQLFEQAETGDTSRPLIHPQWLFFRGYFAVREGRNTLARDSWSQLLSSLPPDSELARLLTEKLAELP